MPPNKGFEEWGTILGDEVMAAALSDRLTHHCHVVNIRGNGALSACCAAGRIERALARKCISRLNGTQGTMSRCGGAACG